MALSSIACSILQYRVLCLFLVRTSLISNFQWAARTSAAAHFAVPARILHPCCKILELQPIPKPDGHNSPPLDKLELSC